MEQVSVGKRSQVEVIDVRGTANEGEANMELKTIALKHLIAAADFEADKESRRARMDEIRRTLGEFRCERDKTTENFIRTQAMPAEMAHICRTYLLVDDAAFHRGELSLVGFFTIEAITVEMNGEAILWPVEGEEDAEHLREFLGIDDADDESVLMCAYAILGIARDDRFDHDDCPGSMMLEEAERLLGNASDAFGGTFIVLQSRREMVPYYEQHGYSALLPEDDDGESDVCQMVKLV